MSVDEEVIEQFCEALRHAYSLARAERLAELRSKRHRSFDSRGLHPFSLEVGRIEALVSLMPELGELDFDPVSFRRQAVHDACLEYEQDVALALGLRKGWITQEQADAMRMEV